MYKRMLYAFTTRWQFSFNIYDNYYNQTYYKKQWKLQIRTCFQSLSSMKFNAYKHLQISLVHPFFLLLALHASIQEAFTNYFYVFSNLNDKYLDFQRRFYLQWHKHICHLLLSTLQLYPAWKLTSNFNFISLQYLSI